MEIYRATEAPATFAIHSYPEEWTCPTSSHIKPSMEKLLNSVQTSIEQKLAKSTLAEMVAEVRQRSGR